MWRVWNRFVLGESRHSGKLAGVSVLWQHIRHWTCRTLRARNRVPECRGSRSPALTLTYVCYVCLFMSGYPGAADVVPAAQLIADGFPTVRRGDVIMWKTRCVPLQIHEQRKDCRLTKIFKRATGSGSPSLETVASTHTIENKSGFLSQISASICVITFAHFLFYDLTFA